MRVLEIQLYYHGQTKALTLVKFLGLLQMGKIMKLALDQIRQQAIKMTQELEAAHHQSLVHIHLT